MSFVEELTKANNNLAKAIPDIKNFIPDMGAYIPKGLFESVQRQHDILKDFGSILSAQQNNIERAARVMEQATASLQLISSVRESWLASFDPIFNLGFRWDGLAKAIIDSMAFEDEEEFKKFEYNWVGFVTVPEIKQLYAKWKEGKHDDVKRFFSEWFCDEKRLCGLLDTFNKNPLFESRMNILSDAVEAHLKGKYTLSIPVFLSQIDGIFIGKHGHLLKDRYVKCPKCKIDVIRVSPNARGICEYLMNRESPYLEYFLRHVVNVFDELRNKILHGIKIDYPNKDLSVKMIATLFEMHNSHMIEAK
jgi:hypothetical protein